MGTRADFWIGHGPEAEWLGSVAWDGDEWGDNRQCPLIQAKTPEEFRSCVVEAFKDRDDATLPEHGWPWPWKDSSSTDYAYVFDHDFVNVYNFGTSVGGDCGDWRDMTDQKATTLGPRSGLMVFFGRN